MSKYKCVSDGLLTSITIGTEYEVLDHFPKSGELKYAVEIQIRNDNGRKQWYRPSLFVEVKDKAKSTPGKLDISAVESRVKKAREELQALEAELKKAKAKPVSKNVIGRLCKNSTKSTEIDRAARTLGAALGTYIAVRGSGEYKGKALYLSSEYNYKIVKDKSENICLVIEDK